jgi:hypothetical protein
MPEQSGAAKRSVKPSYSGSYLAIRAGGAKAPYYGWLDFGGTLGPSGGRRNTQHRAVFKKGRYLYPAIARKRHLVEAAAKRAIEQAKRKAGLR